MTLAACLEHQPMHTFGKGWHCSRCGLPISPKPLITEEWAMRMAKREGNSDPTTGNPKSGIEILPLNDTFVRFSGSDVDVTIDGDTFKAKVGMIGDGHGTPIEAGIVVLCLSSEVAAVDWWADRLGLQRRKAE